jgi:DNA-binding transcriptional ArsR family regulator
VTTDQLAAISALGDGTRLAIFELLADGPRPVGKLAAELPVTRPAVSQHLKVMKEAGLVLEQRQGTRHLYRLDPEGIGAIRTYFERFWNHALAAFKAAVETDQEEAG